MKSKDLEYCKKAVGKMTKDEIKKIILICSKIISKIEDEVNDSELNEVSKINYKNTIASLSGIVLLINKISSIEFENDNETSENHLNKDLNLKFYDKSDIEILKRAIKIYDKGWNSK